MNKLNKGGLCVAAGLLGVFATGTTTMAQSADALIDKLVDKGVLTVKEANDLRVEADKDFNRAYQVKSGLPDWVSSLRLSGDMRGRYEGFFQSSGNTAPNATEDRHRFRYRMRLGVTATLTDQFEVGVRFASGDTASDPLSTNTTMDRNADKKNVYVDLAYGKWTPDDWVTIEAGKMANQFWTSDMIFDGDYTPEGLQEKFVYNLDDKHAFTAGFGQFVIDEQYSATGTAENDDVYVMVSQVDWNAKWSMHLNSRIGVGVMNFVGQDKASAGQPGNGNGVPLSGAGAQDLMPIFGRAEVTYSLESFPRFIGAFPITVGAEYAVNPDAEANSAAYPGKQNEAYNLGVTFGSAKNRGNWQLAYNYKEIQAASVWRGLNDSDFGFNTGGGGDVRGHVVKALYHVYDPLTIGLAYYLTERINNPAGTQAEQQRVQVDLVWTF